MRMVLGWRLLKFFRFPGCGLGRRGCSHVLAHEETPSMELQSVHIIGGEALASIAGPEQKTAKRTNAR
jgi:hypothetical protein